MSVRRQDLCVLLFYYLGYSKIRKLAIRFRGKPEVRILAFHDIPKEAEAKFCAKLQFLKRNTNVVSMDDYFAGELSPKATNVVITFDDGYKSWVSVAAPVLKQLELPATFFVSSGFLGLSKTDEEEFIRSKVKTNRRTTGGLSEKDLRSMAEDGFTIGGHTCNHANLAEMHDQSEVTREVLDDKRRLESTVGKAIDYFAFPFGAYHNPKFDLSQVLIGAGYKGAVTTVPGPNTLGTNAYRMHRELTDASMSGPVFRARVEGNSDGVMRLKRTIAELFPAENPDRISG